MLIEPLTTPVDADIAVPGSKSITNRALVAAALATGESRLRGVLAADDTAAMTQVVQTLGAQVRDLEPAPDLAVVGTGGVVRSGPLTLDARLSGTTARFAAPLAARGRGAYVIDGAPQMRARPMAETAGALRHLGCEVIGESLPLTVHGGFDGGWLTLSATSSSQFASGILLASPGTTTGLDLVLEGDVVVAPVPDDDVCGNAGLWSAGGPAESEPVPCGRRLWVRRNRLPRRARCLGCVILLGCGGRGYRRSCAYRGARPELTPG